MRKTIPKCDTTYEALVEVKAVQCPLQTLIRRLMGHSGIGDLLCGSVQLPAAFKTYDSHVGYMGDDTRDSIA